MATPEDKAERVIQRKIQEARAANRALLSVAQRVNNFPTHYVQERCLKESDPVTVGMLLDVMAELGTWIEAASFAAAKNQAVLTAHIIEIRRTRR